RHTRSDRDWSSDVCSSDLLARSSPIGEERASGCVFVLRADLIPPEARALLASVARVVLVGQRGSLADQLDRVPDSAKAVRSTGKHAVTFTEQPTAPSRPTLE